MGFYIAFKSLEENWLKKEEKSINWVLKMTNYQKNNNNKKEKGKCTPQKKRKKEKKSGDLL